MGQGFATTQWSRVLAARDGDSTEARDALAELCETYWSPLYAFVRHSGYDADDAADLTQGFFAYLLEKNVIRTADPAIGRFRSFLLGTLKHFLSHEREKARASKRGGDAVTLSLQSAEALYGREPSHELTPEQVFERRWALTVLGRAMDRLREESAVDGGLERFDRLRSYVTGERPTAAYAEIAPELKMTEVAVRGAVHRLRRRYGRLVRDEIVQTVAEGEDVDEEIRYLLGVVHPWQSGGS